MVPVLRELAIMLNGIRRYFSFLPIRFSHALLAAALVAFLSGFQTFLLVSARSSHAEPSELIHAIYIFPVLNSGVWLLVLPLLYRLMLRARSNEWRNAIIIILSLIFTVGHEVIALICYNGCTFSFYVLDYKETFEMEIKSGILGLSKTYIEFWVIYFLLYHFHAKKEFRNTQLRNIQLESNLVKAQMSALKNQLHPHFLFNSFNTISALMEEDIPLAQRMIAKLGLLLRKILKDGDVQMISLEDEVELAKLYLEVEQIRFKGRLVTRFSIDPKVKLVSIPTLLLQPAVENAIKHGFYNKTGPCEISIQAGEDDDFVWINVSDNGGGKKNESNVSFGMGLTNMKNRLITSYGEGYELKFNSKSGEEGFIVEIKIRKDAIKKENINRLSG